MLEATLFTLALGITIRELRGVYACTKSVI